MRLIQLALAAIAVMLGGALLYSQYTLDELDRLAGAKNYRQPRMSERCRMELNERIRCQQLELDHARNAQDVADAREELTRLRDRQQEMEAKVANRFWEPINAYSNTILTFMLFMVTWLGLDRARRS